MDYTNYQAFLKSEYWASVRFVVLNRDGYQCQLCGTTARQNLQVHHLTYDHHGEEHQHLEDLVTLCDHCHKSVHGIEVRSATPVMEKPISTSFSSLDNLLGGGFFPGYLYAMCGASSSGKSALANRLAFNIAYLQKLPTIVFSLCGPKISTMYRLLSDDANIEFTKLRRNTLDLTEKTVLHETIQKMNKVKYHLNDDCTVDVASILKDVTTLKNKYGKLGCVVVDSLQMLPIRQPLTLENHHRQLSIAISQLKSMAVKLNVPVVLLAYPKREVSTRQDKRLMISDIRDTSLLAKIADVVFGLYRDELYYPNSFDKNRIEIKTMKNESRDLGKTKLLFHGEFLRFRNLARY